jgi:hypothetical protein
MNGLGWTASWTALKAAGVGAALLLSASAAQAQAGPFGPLAGSWSGNGTITMSDGASERIRCRAKYTPGGSALQITLRCASDSYRFELSSDVTANGNNLNGTWSEESRGINGSLSGTSSGGQFDVFVQASGFAANISVRTTGPRQSVSISSKGDIRTVSISMTRGG